MSLISFYDQLNAKYETMSNFKRTTVTSALPYANGPVHIGHLAGVYVPAHIYVRYLRLKGEDVLEKLGVDSLGWTEVLITLERELNFSISEDDLVEISSFTINDLNQLIENSRRIHNANCRP